ncbi:Glucosamine 6-phosphate N-acetyltransferase [Mycena kentingensis (nom. inval.)]|nr:Glucosamine 6-phosphate N-acetyltransferase [Mycena kentingensis (nom. inval.)]
MSPTFHIVHARADPQIIAECHRIREQVFHVEQKFPLDTEFDEVENVAMHFLVRATDTDPTTGETTVKGVGTIRGTSPDAYPGKTCYKLSRLAVLADYREHKLGRRLVESLHEWIVEDAIATNRPAVIEAHSQLPVIGFYKKFGYIPEARLFHFQYSVSQILTSERFVPFLLCRASNSMKMELLTKT